jgi:hypothetical protein
MSRDQKRFDLQRSEKRISLLKAFRLKASNNKRWMYNPSRVGNVTNHILQHTLMVVWLAISVAALLKTESKRRQRNRPYRKGFSSHSI